MVRVFINIQCGTASIADQCYHPVNRGTELKLRPNGRKSAGDDV